jgi:HlyD family secretion protein
VNRRLAVIALVLAVLAIATGVGIYARSASAVPAGIIAVAGDVRAVDDVVRAPAVTPPSPDYTVGITTTGTAAPTKRPAGTGAPVVSRGAVVSGFLAEVLVSEGSRVSTGDVLARLDPVMLDLGVASSRAAAAKARAGLDVLEHTISKLETARGKLITGRKALRTARGSLSATITVLVRQRASLEASITAIQAIVAQPGGPPPHVPPYPVLLASLQGALSGLNAGLVGARTGLHTIDANLAKLAKGLAQMDTALHKLRDARKLARVNIESADVAVRLAEARRGIATITSPESGLVTFARLPGTAVMVGAPLVRIRPDRPTLVDTYLTTDQLVLAPVGTRVTVDFDSNAGAPLTGRVAVIGDAAFVPPTGFPTAIVHMTRAVRVTIELDQGETAPAGTPVDIEIRTGSAI